MAVERSKRSCPPSAAPGSQNDVIAEGAFTTTIHDAYTKRRDRKGQTLFTIFWQHDYKSPGDILFLEGSP
jgi:hypothetical protein